MQTQTTPERFRTIQASVIGGICGHMWWPQSKAGLPFRGDLRAQINRFSDSSRATFRDVLLHMLMEKGGDFQHSRFTADTLIRVQRERVEGRGRSSTHVREIALSELPDCADLVDEESFLTDFLGEAA